MDPIKTILALLAGVAFVFAYGIAYAEDSMPGNKDTGNTMISGEGNMPGDVDQNRDTVEKTPAGSEAEGAGAGGMSKDPDTWKSDSDQQQAPVEKAPAGSSEEGAGGGGAPHDTYRYRY